VTAIENLLMGVSRFKDKDVKTEEGGSTAL